MTLHRFSRPAAVAVVRRAVVASLCLVASCLAAPAGAQVHRTHQPSKAASTTPSSVPVVMLSDLHFEPFQDPAKVQQLRDAPIEGWPAILNGPASLTQAADFQDLQKACPVRGVDSSWPLLSTSLLQAAAEQPHPLFVTVSGDLLAHAFDCRFKKLAPQATDDDLSAFASKTVDFLTTQLRKSFPATPVYLALGNNDSGCTDYREDRNSPFLRHAAETFAGAAGSADNAQSILRDFPDQGDYNIALPAPLHNARLIVLQNIFETRTFAACDGRPAFDAAGTQLDWLRAQLTEARAQRQHVWVMAHVPPGIDVYSTLHTQIKVCSGQPPAMFLRSEGLADLLTAFPDVISLALFAHSHEDELRYLHAAGTSSGIAVKLVSSISPVNGNRPTFTVARVDPRTATLLDYTVFFAGAGAAATREYSFRETYKLPDFSAASLAALTAGFLTDGASATPASQAYQHFFFPGDNGTHALGLQLFWRAYACSLREDQPDAYRTCACPAPTSPAKE